LKLSSKRWKSSFFALSILFFIGYLKINHSEGKVKKKKGYAKMGKNKILTVLRTSKFSPFFL
jgi:hypothetical protein